MKTPDTARLYADLAPWFHLITHPDEYIDEAAHVVRVIAASGAEPAGTLLELGAGGGNNAFHLKRHFACTLTDLSADMLAVSRTINPDCEHLEGDMRTLRLGRLFDIVFVHDAIGYMTTEDDLKAAIATAAVHARPGGLAIFEPDAITETFAPGTDHGGVDDADGRGARYLEWTRAGEPGATTYPVDYAFMLYEPGGPVRVVDDHHRLGLFPRATWLDAFAGAGLSALDIDVADPYAGKRVVFATRRTT